MNDKIKKIRKLLKYKIIYYPIAKCGSTYTDNLLGNYIFNTTNIDRWNRSNFFKFTVVRNPIGRTISMYNFIMGQDSMLKELSIWGFYKNMPFDLFLDCIDNSLYLIKNDRHLITQVKSISTSKGNVDIDKFIKLEEIHKLPVMIKSLIGIDINDSKKVNVSNKLIGIDNLTTDNILKIEEIYKEDFDFFGYEKLSSKVEKKIVARQVDPRYGELPQSATSKQ